MLISRSWIRWGQLTAAAFGLLWLLMALVEV